MGRDTDTQRIGGDITSNWERRFWGYIDDLRFTKGVCRYTSDFTLPITSYYDHD
jgi:hypothetical protein